MQMPIQYEMQPVHVLMLTILVLYLGFYLKREIRFLSEFYIPPAVTGLLICSIAVPSSTPSPHKRGCAL
jgi:sodium--glutamate symport carrier gltS